MCASAEPIDRETYDLISKSLSHPIRRKVLRLLTDGRNITFTRLRDSLGIDGSHLSYHLNQMGELLKKTEDGSYELSSLGIVAISLMRDVEELSSEQGQKRLVEATTKRPIGLSLLWVGMAIMGVMGLASIGFFWFLFPSFYPSAVGEQLPLVTVTMGTSSIISLAIAFGLRKSKAWGWWSAISFFGGSSVAALLSIFSFPTVSGVLLSVASTGVYVVCVWYLKGSRRWFEGLNTIARRTRLVAIGIGLFAIIVSIAAPHAILSTFIEPTLAVATVRGLVTDAFGNPLSATVYFHRLTMILGGRAITSPVAFSTTDQMGNFSISLPEGFYLVRTCSCGHVVSENETYLKNSSFLAIELNKLNVTVHDFTFSDIFNRTISLGAIDRPAIAVCVWGYAQSIPIRDYLLLLNRIGQSFPGQSSFIIVKTYGADKTPDSLAADGDLSWIVEGEGLSWEDLPEKERTLFYEMREGGVTIPVPSTTVLNWSRQEVFRTKEGIDFIAKSISRLVSNNSLPFVSKLEQNEINGTTRLFLEIHNPGETMHLTVRVECRLYSFGFDPGLETIYQLATPFDASPGTTRLEIDLKRLYRGEMLLILLDGNRLIDIEEVSTFSFSPG